MWARGGITSVKMQLQKIASVKGDNLMRKRGWMVVTGETVARKPLFAALDNFRFEVRTVVQSSMDTCCVVARCW